MPLRPFQRGHFRQQQPLPGHGSRWILRKGPERRISYSSTFITPAISRFSFFAMYSMIAGSISPERVPMISPSRGVRPMLVSTDLPFFTAERLAPLPRWQTMIFRSSYGFPATSAAFFGNEAVGGSVEAVTSYLVVLIVLDREGRKGKPPPAWSDGTRYQILLPSERPALTPGRHGYRSGLPGCGAEPDRYTLRWPLMDLLGDHEWRRRTSLRHEQHGVQLPRPHSSS